MAGFLRKKSKNRQQEPVVSGSSSNAPTPIFARFAASSNSSERQAAPSQSRVIVSQPMSLGSASRVGGTATDGETNRQMSRQLETPRTRFGTSQYPSTVNVNARSNASIHESGAMAAQSARSPPINGTIPSQPQAVTRFLDVDKPLPIPVSTDDEVSPTGVSKVPPVEPTPLIRRSPPQSRPDLQSSFYGARADLVQKGMGTSIEQRPFGQPSALKQEMPAPKPNNISKQIPQPVVRPSTNNIVQRGTSHIPVGPYSVAQQSPGVNSLPPANQPHGLQLTNTEAPAQRHFGDPTAFNQIPEPHGFSTSQPLVRRLTSDIVQRSRQGPSREHFTRNQGMSVVPPPTNAALHQLLPSNIQQSLVRRPVNDVIHNPTSRSQNSTSPRPVRCEVTSPLNAKVLTNSPPTAGSSQPYAKLPSDGALSSIAATVNGPTTFPDALPRGASILGPTFPVSTISQRNLNQNRSPAIPDDGAIPGCGIHDEIGFGKLLPSRPKSPSVGSEDDDLFVDAYEELKQATPVLGARQLLTEPTFHQTYPSRTLPSPEKSLHSCIPEEQPSFGSPNTDTPVLAQVSKAPPRQDRDIDVISGGIDNMGANVSLPATQDSPFMPITISRKLYSPSSPPDDLKMRSIDKNSSPYQPSGPSQEFNRPRITVSTPAARGKPLIFAAMEANIDQPHSGEEQRVSVHVWDGQDRFSGQTLSRYPTPPSSSAAEQMRSAPVNVNSKNTAADYPSPPSSEVAYPRAGEGEREPLQTSRSVPAKPRKLSKSRNPSSELQKQHQRTGSRPVTPVKGRPLTPVSPRPATPKKTVTAIAAVLGSPIHLNNNSDKQDLELPSSRQALRSSGMSLLDVDEDPFAKVEGVRLLAPAAKDKESQEDMNGRRTMKRNVETLDGLLDEKNIHLKKQVSIPSIPSIESDGDGVRLNDNVEPDVKFDQSSRRAEKRTSATGKFEANKRNDSLPSLNALENGAGIQSSFDVNSISAKSAPTVPRERGLIGLVEFISNGQLLSELLAYLSFYEWCLLASVNKNIRTLLSSSDDLREAALERFLKTVGYAKWSWENPEPLPLTLQDLNDYMFGVSTPTHEYARVADLYVKSLAFHPGQQDPELGAMVRRFTAATRAYSRVVLRLRAQAEKETTSRVSPLSAKATHSRPPSRASSPTQSSFSHGRRSSCQYSPSISPGPGFKSPLFRPKRAPLLRVFVPSPDGDWLSDKSLLECEEECRRAGIMKLIRFGDIVWDVAVGDEGNVGRLIWDGSYLIDLDYSFSPVGDLPKYIPALAFPPSYFHKVIRTGPGYSNPIAHIDLRPWGDQIAVNLQLLQDRVRTETPQGTFHNVVRWVHRSSFVVRPPSNSVRHRGSPSKFEGQIRIQIPDAKGLFVDPGWYGTIVVETEGTNEALADLQDRCGPGVFPPRATGVSGQMGIKPTTDARKVFRVLREKSRPGEIWIKAVTVKERML